MEAGTHADDAYVWKRFADSELIIVLEIPHTHSEKPRIRFVDSHFATVVEVVADIRLGASLTRDRWDKRLQRYASWCEGHHSTWCEGRHAGQVQDMQPANRVGHRHHHVNRVRLAMAGLAKPDVCHREITPCKRTGVSTAFFKKDIGCLPSRSHC